MARPDQNKQTLENVIVQLLTAMKTGQLNALPQIKSDLDSLKNDMPHAAETAKHQFAIAQTLCKLADTAVQNEKTPWDVSVEQTTFWSGRVPSADTLWQWNAYCALRGHPRTTERTIRIGIVCIDANGEAKRGTLLLEEVFDLHPDNDGQQARLGRHILYPSPLKGTIFLHGDGAFQNTLAAAQAVFAQRGNGYTGDIRWSLQLWKDEDIPGIGGGSVGGAFALGIYKLVANIGDELDVDGVTVTAALAENGGFARVEGIEAKLEQLVKKARLVIVAEGQPVSEEMKKRPDFVFFAQNLDAMVKIVREQQKERQALREQIRSDTEYMRILNFKNIPIEKHYQPLPLLEEVKEDALRKKDAEDRGKKSRGQSFSFWEEARVYKQARSYQPHQLAELLARSAVPRFVVIGSPGSGKSTLLQHLAHQIATNQLSPGGKKPIPVRISLAQWQSSKIAGLSAYLTTLFSNCSLRPDAPKWQQWLERGEVLLLLDGLDELSGQDPDFFAREVVPVVRDFKLCPVILTCRTVSYGQYQTLGLPAFTIAGLDQSQQKAFIENFPKEADSKYDHAKLWQQLQTSPHLQLLASNPLLLNLICFVTENQNEPLPLPATRGQFYEKAIAGLLQRTRIAVECPKMLVKEDVLAQIALALFIEDKRESFSLATLATPFRETITKAGYTMDKGEELLTDFMRNSGIIQKSPRSEYFFLHLTFHEYFAALALAQKINGKDGWDSLIPVGDGKPVTVCHLVDHKAWDSAWEEVVKLLAGQLNDPAPLLEMLSDEKPTETNPNGDDMFRHRLALAAKCLPEIPQEIRKKPNIVTLVDQITTQAFGLWWKHRIEHTEVGIEAITIALPALAQANGCYLNSKPMLTWLAAALKDETGNVQSRAVAALGEMGAAAATPDIYAALHTALKEPESEVRLRAAWALGEMGAAAATPDIHAALHTALKEPESEVRLRAVWALGEMGAAAATPDIIVVLLAALKDPEIEVRGRAAWVLGEMGAAAATPDILAALLHAALQDQNGYVYWSAARALGSMGAATPDSLAALQDKNSDVLRWMAAFALGKMGAAAATPETLAALAALQDKNSEVRGRAALALGKMGAAAATPDIHAALHAALQDQNNEVRRRAEWALGKMGAAAATPAILAALHATLKDQDSNVRWRAAATLAELMKLGVRLFGSANHLNVQWMQSLAEAEVELPHH
jgi:HEAT repeat protein/energy-coupling factor transporter ATP-binding protein EcfA2